MDNYVLNAIIGPVVLGIIAIIFVVKGSATPHDDGEPETETEHEIPQGMEVDDAYKGMFPEKTSSEAPVESDDAAVGPEYEILLEVEDADEVPAPEEEEAQV